MSGISSLGRYSALQTRQIWESKGLKQDEGIQRDLRMNCLQLARCMVDMYNHDAYARQKFQLVLGEEDESWDIEVMELVVYIDEDDPEVISVSLEYGGSDTDFGVEDALHDGLLDIDEFAVVLVDTMLKWDVAMAGKYLENNPDEEA